MSPTSNKTNYMNSLKNKAFFIEIALRGYKALKNFYQSTIQNVALFNAIKYNRIWRILTTPQIKR